MQEPIVSVSGVRGIVGESFTHELVRAWVKVFAGSRQWAGGSRAIVLGRDTRPSGERAIEITAQMLAEQGVQPIIVGIAPTPTIQLAVTHHRAAGAMIITASHNPQEWNGLKFLGSDGVFLTGEEMEELHQRVIASLPDRQAGEAKRHFVSSPRKRGPDSRVRGNDNDDTGIASSSRLGGTPRNDDEAVSRHIENILSLPIDIERIRAREFRVVVDPVNGAGAVAVPLLLQRLGCDVTVINGEPNGQFAHTPEPTPANLTELGKRVAAERADLGIAVDPDADRLVLVDETGTVISEEYAVTLAVLSVLGMGHGAWGIETATVVVNLSTTRMVDDVAKQCGATVVRTPVGERNVVEGMRQHRALIGGEGSGGVIFPRSHEGRDSLVGIALVLDLLARSNDFNVRSFRPPTSEVEKMQLSTVVESLPKYLMTKEKFPRSAEFNTEHLAAKLKQAFPDVRIDTRDGIRVDTADGWAHLRPSNTEPIIRLIAEGTSEHVVANLSAVVHSLLPAAA